MAPHALQITDGVTTISLSTYASNAGVMLNSYRPLPPSWDNDAGQYKPVSEDAAIHILDTTAALTQARIATIERLLAAVISRAQSGRGPRVYIQYKTSSDADWWRSELLDARLQLGDDALAGLSQGIMPATLLWTRSPFWEGISATIPLTNPNGTNNTSGLRVYFCNDQVGTAPTKRANYADIASSVIEGAIDAPLQLTFTNDSGATMDMDNIRVANNPWGTITHWYEGEAGVGGTNISDATASGSSYKRISAGGGGAGQYISFRWQISAATLAVIRGRSCHVLCKFSQLTGIHEAKLELYDSLNLVRVGPEAMTQVIGFASGGYEGVWDLGTIDLPSVDYGASSAAMYLGVSVRALVNSEQFGIDWIAIMPSEPGLYRDVVQLHYGWSNGDAVVDDGAENITYVLDAGVRYYNVLFPLTEPVCVRPAIAQRLIISFSGFVSSSQTGNSLLVKASYRPRRLTF